MSEKRGWGKSVIGWFVVQDEENQSTSAPAQAPATAVSDVDALLSKYGGAPESPIVRPVAAQSPELSSPVPPAPTAPTPAVVVGDIDFAPVYEQSGIDAQERDRVAKAIELLRSLPMETPAPVKRQIVEASLRAFGVPTDKIIEAAVGEIEALEGFICKGQSDTQAILADSSDRIAELEKEIASYKQIMQNAVTEQSTRTSVANGEKLKIQQVLEFFGQETVAKVVQGSPRLRSPGGT